MSSFLCQEELDKIGFKSLGKNVLISRKASVYLPELISIGNNVRIDDFVILSGEITLENNIHIASYSALFGGKGDSGIVMKNYSGLSSRVTIYSLSDDYSGEFMTSPVIPSKYTNVQKGRVIIQQYVIVGATSVILPGLEIGEGTAVGAMSMVINSLPEWKICRGIPARALMNRSKKLKELEKQFAEAGVKMEQKQSSTHAADINKGGKIMKENITLEQIIQIIKNYLFENYLFGYNENEFNNDSSFLKLGIIDSTGILELILFIESQFGIEVKDEEILPENFDSINYISNLVYKKVN